MHKYIFSVLCFADWFHIMYRLFNVLCWLWNIYEGAPRGSGVPECIFHKQHKTLYNLFSPDPTVSCVDFTS